MSVVSIESVTLSRGGKRILQGVDWRIEQGEHWALLGANGSGKTTLLKVLTGYEWPSEGTVTVLDRRFGFCDLRVLRRSIGWVSAALEHRIPQQDTALDVVASGLDSSFGLYREIEQAGLEMAEDALARVHLGGFSKRIFGTLSQGERKRTLIARALVRRPAVLVLDEPCAGLDPVSRAEFLGQLGDFAQSDAAPTVIFVTHHIEEIGPWVSHALMLREGAVLAGGQVKDVITSDLMSEALGRPCEASLEGDCYALRLSPPVNQSTE